MKRVILVAGLLLVVQTALAHDDAELLSRRIPNQAYYVAKDYAVLEKKGIRWVIPLWSCDPANLKVIKVLGKSPPAPYAVEITVSNRDRIEAPDNVMRLQSIHLLAASLDDAVKIRRALVAEIASMRRTIEKQRSR